MLLLIEVVLRILLHLLIPLDLLKVVYALRMKLLLRLSTGSLLLGLRTRLLFLLGSPADNEAGCFGPGVVMCTLLVGRRLSVFRGGEAVGSLSPADSHPEEADH